jgi:outer membrane protein assembly factor BamB
MKKQFFIPLLLSLCWMLLPGQHPKLLWKKAHTIEVLTPPLVLRGHLVFADRNGSLLAFTSEGKPVWSVTIREGCYAPPVASPKGPIYLTTNNHLYAVSADGRIQWKIRLDSPARTSAVTFKDRIYVFSIDGTTGCYNKAGKQLWQKSLKKQIFATPRCDSKGNLFVPTHEYTLYKLSPRGRFIWRFPTPGVLKSTPSLYTDTLLLQTSMDHHLYALNRQTGRLVWKFKAGYWILSSPVSNGQGTIFFGSYDKHLYAVTRSGKLKWRTPLKASTRISAAQDGAGNLFTADDSGTIYKISRQGKIDWQYKTEDSIYSPLAWIELAGKQLILAANISGYLYCFSSNERPSRRQPY